MPKRTSHTVVSCLLAGFLSLLPTRASTETIAGDDQAFAPMFDWQTIGVAQGLPSEKVTSVAVDGSRVWIGTEKGLALLEGEQLTTFDADDGLPFCVVSALAVDPESGDVWIGTLGGLARYSAGRIDAFTQLDSGLVNDVVYGVATSGGDVWVATAAGLNRFDPRANTWTIFDVTNTLMHEPWCYAVSAAGDKVYVAVWGGGVLVRDGETGTFREHRDPDGEMEIDLYRDDGLVHDVTSSVSVAGKVMWVGTYFGLSRYDGRHWRSFNQDDSGLAGDFINQVQADGERVWVATDEGLSLFGPNGWRTWRRSPEGGGWSVTLSTEEGQQSTFALDGGPANNRIFGLALDGRDVWLATAGGLCHGIARDGAQVKGSDR